MKTNRDYLLKVMQLASRFAPTAKNLHSALSCVRMQVVEAGAMSISATNGKDSIFAWLPVTDPKPFAALVPAGTLYSVLGQIAGEEVTFKMVKDRFVLQRKNGDIRMMTTDLGYFPAQPAIDDATNWIQVETADIHEMVKSLLCGTSEERASTTSFHNVAMIRSAGPEFLAAASDGNRMALVDGKCSSEAGIELLVPLQALRAIDSALTSLKTAKTVHIGESKKQIWVRVNDYLQFCFTKLNVKFPNVDQVLSATKFTMSASAKTKNLMSAFSLARVLGDVGVRLELGKGKGRLIAAKKDAGDVEEEFEINQAAPFEIVTGYNSDYIIPILQRIESEYAGLDICHTEAKGTRPETFTLRITQETDRLRSSWIVQSLNKYPGAKLEKKNEHQIS